MRVFKVRFFDNYSESEREILLKADNILEAIPVALEKEKMFISNIYSISEVDCKEYFEIKKKEERFKRFRRYIENYIYNEIDLDNFNISDYFDFMNRFYSFEFEYEYEFPDDEFRIYVERLNEELRKILDL